MISPWLLSTLFAVYFISFWVFVIFIISADFSIDSNDFGVWFLFEGLNMLKRISVNLNKMPVWFTVFYKQIVKIKCTFTLNYNNGSLMLTSFIQKRTSRKVLVILLYSFTCEVNSIIHELWRKVIVCAWFLLHRSFILETAGCRTDCHIFCFDTPDWSFS